ncbi:hypothetical protein [Rubripirellula tenax]|nr:hypothetical protein [Rubripirellula tenax]
MISSKADFLLSWRAHESLSKANPEKLTRSPSQMTGIAAVACGGEWS